MSIIIILEFDGKMIIWKDEDELSNHFIGLKLWGKHTLLTAYNGLYFPSLYSKTILFISNSFFKIYSSIKLSIPF